MKKVLLSLLTVGVVGVAAFGASQAFFSDTETSTGNTLVAGKLDLKVDSTAHYDGMVCQNSFWVDEDADSENNPRPELLGAACDGSWTSADLTQEKFFNLSDIKPGDWGENTISLTPEDNKAWACLRIDNLVNDENTIVGPETKAGDVTDGVTGGELAQNVYFTAWADDGDNVWEDGEQLLFTNTFGPASDVLGGKTYALADSSIGVPFEGGVTKYIGLQWCAGTMTVSTGDHSITCNGAGMGNDTQTDMMTADMHFYVEQFRNNEEFNCSNVIWPTPTEAPLPEAAVTQSTSWSIVDTDANGGSQGKEWFAKSRNNNGGFEIAVGTNDALPAGQDTADTTWVAGASNPFTLSYDGAGNASYTAGGQTVNFAVGTTGYGRIGINVKAPDAVTTTVDTLALSVAAPLSINTLSVLGIGNTVQNLLISGVNLDQAWTLTGNFMFSAVGGSSQEYPAVQFSID